MKVTLELPDEYAQRLGSLEDDLPRILEMGMREWESSADGEFAGVADVLESLANLPTPEEVLAMRAAPVLANRVAELLAKNRAEELSADEEREWRKYEYLEHLVRIAKASALLNLKSRDDGE